MPQDNKAIISISKGPQFMGGEAGGYLFMGFMMVMVFLVGLTFQGNTDPLLYGSPFLAVLFLAIIDLRGVQIDTKRNKIREYKVKLWGKSGNWMDFGDYDKIVMDLDSYTVKIANLYPQSRGGRDARAHTNEKHSRFIVYFQDDESKNENLLVFESRKYKPAISFARKLSKKLNLPFHDSYEVRLENSRRRR